MRKLAALLAIAGLMTVSAAQAETYGVRYSDSCRDSLVEGNAGAVPYVPTARCTASGGASPAGSLFSSGTLTTPASGYAPGAGLLDGSASAETIIALAEPRSSVEVVATVLIEHAASTQMGRLGLLAPRVTTGTWLSLRLFNAGCYCFYSDQLELTSTDYWQEQEITNRTVEIRGFLSTGEEEVLSGVLSAEVTLAGYATTGVSAIGSGSWDVRGRVLSIALA